VLGRSRAGGRAWVAVVVVVAAGLFPAAAGAGSLHGRWSLDTAPGGNTTPDDSGNGLTGTGLGGTIGAGGRFGNALTLATAGEGFRVAGDSLLEPQRLTVAVWAKRSGVSPTFRQLVEKGGQGCAQASYGLSTGPDGGLRFSLFLNDIGGGSSLVSLDNAVAPSTIWDGQWHAIAGTYDGDELRLWVDGVLAGTTPKPLNSTTIRYALTDSRLAVGKYAQDSDPGVGACDPNGFAFLGSLDELRLYDRALSPGEIGALQDAGAASPPVIPDPPPVPPPGATRWEQVGGQINRNAAKNASLTSLANVGGALHVSWAESPSLFNRQVRVSRLNAAGTAFSELGCPDVACQAPINNSASESAQCCNTSLTDVGGVPYVAWSEFDSLNQDVRVSRLDNLGSEWEQVPDAASPVNHSSAQDAQNPRMTTIAGVPWAAWSETDPTGYDKIRVSRLVGGAWQEAGTGCPACSRPINVSPTGEGTTPSITSVGGEPWVAWVEQDGGAGSIFVSRFDGNGWVLTAPPLNTGSTAVFDPKIVNAGGTPFVAWREDDGTNIEVRVSRLNTSVWVPVTPGASPVNADPTRDAREVDIAASGTTPYVAWTENDGVNRELHVSRLGLSTWEPLVPGPSPVNADPSRDARDIDLEILGAVPHLAWSEEDANGVYQARVARFGSPQPVNTARPQLSGTPKVGQSLTCTNGSWDQSPTLTTLWDRAPRGTSADDDPGWAAIDGASGSQYVVQAADAGSRVRCRVVATNSGGTAEAPSTSLRADAGVPSALGAPRVVGAPVSGTTLTCDPGAWDGGPDFTYRWLRDNEPIAGATQATYVPTGTRDSDLIFNEAGDGGHALSCEVSGANDVGTGPAARSGFVRIFDGVPANTGRPSASLDLVRVNPVGRIASCSSGAWLDGVDYEYEWLRNGQPIAGATDAGYRTTLEDLGTDLRCAVTGVNPVGRSRAVLSNALRVALPPGTSDGRITLSGGGNEFDPVNLLALSGEYRALIKLLTIERLKRAVATETARCRSVAGVPATAPAPKSVKAPVDVTTRCAILLRAPDAVQVAEAPVSRGGGTAVRYVGTGCIVVNPVVTTSGICADLGFVVTPIDPTTATGLEPDLQAQLEPVTPVRVLWDVNGDGRTDATCPGSAPVLRTMLDRGNWRPRAVIVVADSATTGIFGSAEVSFSHPSGSSATTKGGLRPGQPFACRTSVTPPPPKDPGPCVTDGVVGRVRITGNLCPISVRSLDQDEIEALKAKDEKLWLTLKRLAEALDVSQHKRRDDRVLVGPESGAGLRAFTGVTAFQRELNATYVNTSSSLQSVEAAGFRPDSRLKINGTPLSAAGIAAMEKIPGFTVKKANFAVDQIYLTTRLLKVNGVSVDPLDDSIALLVPSDVREAAGAVKSMTLSARNATRSVVQQAGAGLKKVVLSEAESLQTQFRDVPGGAASVLPDTNLDALADRLAKSLDLGPFRLSGTATVKLENDGTATLKAKATLPWLKLDPSGGKSPSADITMRGDPNGRLQLEGVAFRAPSAYLFGVKLSDLDIRYDGNGLSVAGKILLPNGEGIEINEFKIDDQGRFVSLDVTYVAGAGGGIPVGPGVFMTKLGGGLRDSPDEIRGRAAFSVGPSPTPGGCPAVGVEAEFNAHFSPRPVFFDATGNVVLACIPLNTIKFRFDETGYVALSGGVDVSLGPIYYKSLLGGSMRMPDWQIEFHGEGGIRGLPLKAQMQVVLSNLGLAGCAELDLFLFDIAGGAGVRFPNGRPPLSLDELVNNIHLFTGCDLGSYRSLPTTVARAAQSRTTSFEVEQGAGGVALSLEGAGAAPRIRLRSPKGRVLDFTNATGDGVKLDGAFGTIIDAEDRTVVLLKAPEPGRWTAETAAGSTSVVRVRRADVLPPPKITAKVAGAGPSRLLTYDVAARKGQVVRFVEQAPGAQKVLKTVKQGGKGSVRFVTSEATGTRRTIVAQVIQDGLPRANLTVARFTAPSPGVGRPGRVRVRRSGSSRAIVTWGAAPFAARYEVVVVAGDGARTLLTPAKGKRQVVVTGVQKGEGLSLSVVGISARGRRGAAGRGKLAGSMRVGATKKPKKS
jgi:hypothetical protein